MLRVVSQAVPSDLPPASSGTGELGQKEHSTSTTGPRLARHHSAAEINPIATEDHLEDYGTPAAGLEEVDVVPWSTLFRDRFRALGRDGRSWGRSASSPTSNPPSTSTSTPAVSMPESARRLRRRVLLTVLFGNFSTGVTFTIFAGSVKSIAKELGSNDALLVWVVTGPLLAAGIFGPMFGKAGDIWGHRRLYLFGMSGATVFAALTSQAWNGWSLIAFRVMGAAAGAALGPASMALIFRVFDTESRVKAMGWWSFVGAGAPVIGVAVGGPLVERGLWRWIFAVQIPLCMITLLVALRTLPESERSHHRRFDIPGAATLGLTSSSLLFGLNRAPAWGWTHPLVLLSLAISPIAIVSFGLVERRSDHPMLPLAFLRRRNFTAPILTQAFLSFAYIGGFYLVPQMLQEKGLFAFSVTRANGLTIARPLLFSLVSPIAGWFATRSGERRAGVVGALIIGISMVSLFSVVAGAPTPAVFLAIGLSGVGFGIAGPAMSSSVANSVGEDDLGIAGACFQLAGSLGNVAGVQTMLTIEQLVSTRSGVGSGYRAAFVAGALACVGGAFVASRVRNLARVTTMQPA